MDNKRTYIIFVEFKRNGRRVERSPHFKTDTPKEAIALAKEKYGNEEGFRLVGGDIVWGEKVDGDDW